MACGSSTIFVIDNGSRKPSAILSFRKLAKALSMHLGRQVEPVSLMHSNEVAAEALDGQKAHTLLQRFEEEVANGQRKFIFLPLFIGPSLGVVRYLPKLVEQAQQNYSNIEVRIASPLCGSNIEQPDIRLAEILLSYIEPILVSKPTISPYVLVTDHGSPQQKVNVVRNAIARQLNSLITKNIKEVIACSMERREGDEYSFNEPLLETVHTRVQGVCIVAMLFLFPGRHAGNGGDIETICQALCEESNISEILITPLLGEHKLIIEILADRYDEAVDQLLIHNPS